MNLTRDERDRVRAMVERITTLRAEWVGLDEAARAAAAASAAKKAAVEKAEHELRGWLNQQPCPVALVIGGHVFSPDEGFFDRGPRMVPIVALDPPAPAAPEPVAPPPPRLIPPQGGSGTAPPQGRSESTKGSKK